MGTRADLSIRERLAAMLGRIRWPAGAADLRQRFATWRWPAVQMTVASALAFLLARVVAEDSASYAPITAIVAIGLGRERRIERSGQLVAGLALGAVVAEATSTMFGAVFWQVGLVLGATALLAGVLLDAELAVSYAAINASVLIAIPGSEGWLPERMVAAFAGVLTAVVVVLVLLPPSPGRQLSARLRRLAAAVEEAADTAAEALRAAPPDRDELAAAGDDRSTIAAARRLDDEIERSHTTADTARQIARWSPVRRWRGDDAAFMRSLAHDLRPSVRTMSTMVRLSDRMLLHGVRACPETVEAIEHVGQITREVICQVIERADLDGELQERLANVLGRLRDVAPTHASEIAVHEELVGMVGDLREMIRARDINVPGRDQLAVDRDGIRLGPT